MKDKVRYTDEPMKVGRILPNFLPPPDQLIFKEDAVKVTITLSARSVYFFKAEAEKRGVQYQRMIRRLLDSYVDAFEGRPSASELENQALRALNRKNAANRRAAKVSKPPRSGSTRRSASGRRPG